MRYILPCLLGSSVRKYHRELVEEIAGRFGLTVTQRQGVPAHFTLKYHFETREIEGLEAVLEEFARRQRSTPITVGSFGHFDEDVVFVEVRLSEAARRAVAELIVALRTLPWMTWSPHDAESLHPHMTVAEQCRPRFAEVWAHLATRERHFTAAFDNVTILKKVGEDDGMDLWAIHRSFDLRPLCPSGERAG